MIESLPVFIQNLPPGIDPVVALLLTLKKQFIIPRTRAITIELWVLFGGSCLILILSIIGIAIRYHKKVAWLFARNSDGTIRPNAALTVQFCFMLYAAFHLVVLPTVFLNDKIPTNLAFIWQLISFTPLGFAFIFITWSTILAPTTSLSFLTVQNNRSTFLSTHRRSRNISYIAIFAATVFQLSLIGPAIYTTRCRKHLIAAGVDLMSGLIVVKMQGTGVQGLLALEPTFEFFLIQAKVLLRFYKISVAVYCSWTFLWVCLYVPAAIKLILTLRQRRHQLIRSVKSLQVLDNLVTNDDMIELSKISSSQSISISISPPPSPKSPKRPRLSYQISQQPLVAQRNLHGRPPSPAPRSFSVDLGTPKALASPCPSTNPLLSSPLTPSSSNRSESYFPTQALTRPVATHQQRSSQTIALHRSSPNNSLTRLGEIYQISDSGASSSTLEFRNNTSSKEFDEGVLKNVAVELKESKGKQQRNVPPALTFPAVGVRSSSIGTNGTVIGIGTALGNKMGYSRSQERLDELRLTLARTNRLLLTILIQFLLAFSMSSSYTFFGVVILSGKVSHSTLQNVYASWTGWTFVGPALIGTVIFTIMSFLGPRASFIPKVPQSTAPIVTIESEFVPASDAVKRLSGSTNVGCKGGKSGTFLGVDLSTFTTISHSHSQTPSRVDDNSLHTSISSNNTKKKNQLKKATSIFSIHSLFTPQSSLDAASISRRGRVESMLDVSELDKIKICGSGTGEETSNNTNSGSSGCEKWDNSDLEERNLTGSNGWARGSNQRWLPSDWAKEESIKKDEELGGE